MGMKSIKDIFRSYAVLDADGKHINGTDKESNHHYSDAYEAVVERYLSPNNAMEYGRSCEMARNSVRLVMEVGVADGSCLCAWREIFPNATIVGMDIHHSDKAHGERIEFYLGDQRIKADCDRAVAGRQFDLIVEDATHKLGDTLTTFFWLWPFVKPGGLYVVEEWEGIGGSGSNVLALWSNASIIGTCGPHIDDEPLVVFRKPV